MIPWSTVRVGGKDIYQIIKDNPTRMNEGMFDSIHEAVKKMVGKSLIVKEILVMVLPQVQHVLFVH